MSLVINKEYLNGVINDVVSDLLYYDRKEDDTLPVGKIDEMVKNGEVTIDELVEAFKTHLTKGLK